MPGERTEPATPRRRGEARARGQVLRSTEVNTVAMLLAGAIFLQWSWPGMARAIMELTVHAFESLPSTDLTDATLQAKLLAAAWWLGRLVGPLLAGLVAVGVLVNLAQFGLLLTGQTLKPQLSRINPLEGAKRLFSGRSLVELAKTLVKVALITLVVWQALSDKGSLLASLAGMAPGAAGATLVGVVMGLLWKLVLGLAVLAAADYFYQRWWLERGLRMSRDEIKEELKQQEGDPQIRARLRQRARALARQRMMRQVPKADVVVTNPIHYAVALRYEPGMEAPVVIAKGERLIAQQIKKIAREHGVPLVENVALAQALYKSCAVGQLVPPELYKAVAEVLAFVYRLYPSRAPAGFAAATA